MILEFRLLKTSHRWRAIVRQILYEVDIAAWLDFRKVSMALVKMLIVKRMLEQIEYL